MIELERSMIHKWILDKNVNSKDILSGFAEIVCREQEGFLCEEIVDQTVYRGRIIEGDNAMRGSTITVGVRLLQACFYMFGYSTTTADGKKTFMPSPMTLNIINAENDSEKVKNYLVSLFCMQYPHPFNRTPDCFNIYIGRLIIKLLLDNRISRRLYIDECIWFLPFIETINECSYKELVDSILEYRNKSYEEKLALFKSVDDYNNLFANVTHEINYYLIRLFNDFGVLSLVEDRSHNGGQLFSFLHSQTNASRTYRNDAYKSRKHYSGYVELSQVILDDARKLIASFSPFDMPSRMDGEGIFSKEDWLTNIYQTEPLQYLSCINADVDRNSNIMAIVNEMIRASKFGTRDGREFETALKPFMELFTEAVNIEPIGGAGNTDVLCTMEELPSHDLYNMNVEAKTRNSALAVVETTRINKHLRKHGSQFCIIIAPRFARGVNNDIAGNQIVTIRSEEFGNYCYKECTSSETGLADFSAILEIIRNNMGKEITSKVRNLTEARYGIAVND